MPEQRLTDRRKECLQCNGATDLGALENTSLLTSALQYTI